MRLPICASLAFCLALAPPTFAAIPAAYDDCDARFVAPLGSDTYQFHPGQPGELGRVRLFAVLSHQGAYRTAANQSTLTLTESLTSGTYYYFVRAVQADGNTLWSSPMWITYGPGGGCGACSTDVSGWRLAQINSTFNYTIPANTRIPDHGYLVIGRNATKAAFEAFWRGGTPLPANVLYLNAGDTMPVINGSEQYTLTNAAGTTVDGRTVAMPSAAGSSLKRKDPCLGATLASSWTTTASSTGTPDTGAATGCARGVVINEFSDALGTGNFIYEFIELHNDR